MRGFENSVGCACLTAGGKRHPAKRREAPCSRGTTHHKVPTHKAGRNAEQVCFPELAAGRGNGGVLCCPCSIAQVRRSGAAGLSQGCWRTWGGVPWPSSARGSKGGAPWPGLCWGARLDSAGGPREEHRGLGSAAGRQGWGCSQGGAPWPGLCYGGSREERCVESGRSAVAQALLPRCPGSHGDNTQGSVGPWPASTPRTAH